MGAGKAARVVRRPKIKRPGGVFWYDLQQVAQDGDGTWLRGPVGFPLGRSAQPVAPCPYPLWCCWH